jgi:hypothetical protein
MQFRLIYKGRLPAEGSGGTRAKEKQELRKHFHKQLRELWKQHPALKEQASSYFTVSTTPSNMSSEPGPNVRLILPTWKGGPGAKTWLEHVADSHEKFGTKFVPLVSRAGGFTCAIDILFMRLDNPGSVVKHGGDLDNRIKVLLDGLRMPDNESELAGIPFDTDEQPFFSLLEDDKLITSLKITTDMLLEPGDKPNDVFLVLHVTVVNPIALFAGGRLV